MSEKRVISLGVPDFITFWAIGLILLLIGLDIHGIRKALDRAYPEPPAKESPK